MMAGGHANEPRSDKSDTDSDLGSDEEDACEELQASLVLQFVRSDDHQSFTNVKITPSVTPTPSRKGSIRRKAPPPYLRGSALSQSCHSVPEESKRHLEVDQLMQAVSDQIQTLPKARHVNPQPHRLCLQSLVQDAPIKIHIDNCHSITDCVRGQGIELFKVRIDSIEAPVKKADVQVQAPAQSDQITEVSRAFFGKFHPVQVQDLESMLAAASLETYSIDFSPVAVTTEFLPPTSSSSIWSRSLVIVGTVAAVAVATSIQVFGTNQICSFLLEKTSKAWDFVVKRSPTSIVDQSHSFGCVQVGQMAAITL